MQKTKFIFESKAKTLENIHNNLNTAKTLPVFRLCVKDYKKNSALIEDIQTFFSCPKIVIRSSAQNEDRENKSNAGAFESILNIDLKDRASIDNAIKTVINSYDSDNEENEIFVQPMLENVKMAGVAFSCDVSSLSPYYVINYDESGGTDAVTSGSTNNTKTYIQYKNSEYDCGNSNVKNIINAVKELENIFNNRFIDVEFAVCQNEEVYILQVRPIVTKGRDISVLNLDEGLFKIYKKIEKLQQPHPNLLGDKTIFGVMPDWNPAEIIGVKPKKLALSLYKELVTDNIWAYQRDNYGYRNLRSHPLLISFLGVPFIDVRVDFNSFIPKELDKEISEKLTKYYIEKLYKIPKYHDKVEFKIVHSCYYLNLSEKLKELENEGFCKSEIKAIEKSLLDLTNNIICPHEGLYKKDLGKIKLLEKKYDEILSSNISIIDKIYWLIEDCKRYGTLPFAGVARAAFIAVQFLKSFVELNIITQDEYDRYMNSLSTVSKDLNADLAKLSQEDFLKIWGHLRPGTYDITSLRYDEAFESYFGKTKKKVIPDEEFEFSSTQLKLIDEKLKKHGLKLDSKKLLTFIKEAIEGREYSKFLFTKHLSYILMLIEQLSARFDISREDAAFIDIKLIQDMYSVLDFREVGTSLRDNINFNKVLYEYTKIIKLPSIILNPEDIYGFYLEDEEPNFITLNKIKAEIIQEKNISKTSLAGKIVFIKSADPGYDFLFTKNIGGLITQFGGANSHMAIRCAELGIPAVIGAGEKNFCDWSKANVGEIDCSNKQVRIIS